jgi:hypothetical protein
VSDEPREPETDPEVDALADFMRDTGETLRRSREERGADPDAPTSEPDSPHAPEEPIRPISGVSDDFATGTSPNGPDAPNALRELLADLAAYIRRYVVVTREQADALSLWVVHTHAIEAADTTPYQNVTSAEKRSGKTVLLETLELVVARPWLTGRTTAAALVRKIDGEQPTLLLDESDTAFAGDREYSETLRGVLNTGFRRGGRTTVCVVQGATIGYTDLSTFGAKAIAGISRLPDTVEDRSIVIRLARKTKTEVVERFRRREVAPVAEELRVRAEQLADAHIEVLRDARPELPDELSDRAQDVWEPLFAIADLAGGEWPQRSRHASVVLAAEVEDESLSVRLLDDIHKVFDGKEQPGVDRTPVDRIPTSELLARLGTIDTSPWGNWYGKTITAPSVSKLLKDHGIKTMAVWVGGQTVRGYKREQFWDAWQRYVPDSDEGVRPSGGVRPGAASEAGPDAPNAPNAPPEGGRGGADERLPENEQTFIDALRDELDGEEAT